MNTRFNRNDDNVKDDRLFCADFQVDQNGQDADILQTAKDFGCLPCIGSGLGVTSLSEPDHKVQIAAGWAYDADGNRITISSAQEAVLDDTTGGNNYVILSHQFVLSDNRNAHRTGVSYPTRKSSSFVITVQGTAPGVDDVCLANCKQTGTGPITIDVAERLSRECKLISQDKVPGVIPEGEEAAGPPPPPGSKPELPDYPKGRDVPMPIILQGTRSGEAWGGIETIMPEELGRTAAAQSALTLERVNLKTGTPLADVKVWIGDWGTGIRDAVNLKKCSFTMPAKSGCSAWDDDLWITDPPGYYYLVKADESWYSKITDSGDTWVICADDLPDAASGEYYVCPYAEIYRSQVIPYKTDVEVDVVNPQTMRFYNRIASPTAPILLIKNLNLGGKYKVKAASVISGDNYTRWAEADFIVGSDFVTCWQPSSAYLNVIPVDGGVEVIIPAPTGGTIEPEAYELCYTYGTDAVPDPPTPDFDNPEHPTIRTKERKVKIDAPPGRKVKIKCRAIFRRTVMRCAGVDKILASEDAYVTAGGVSIRRNRKAFTNPIMEDSLDIGDAALADQQKLPNPIWPENVSLFNPTGTEQKDFEVYIHGSNEDYLAGRKIQIGEGGDAGAIGARGWVEKAISDYRISDQAMKVTIKNIHAENVQGFDLRYTVEYREDAAGELA